ncbi:MAG: sodium:proton antiporter NhaD [Bacteroidota bacterium]|jgi:Na+/H+ antiporter NhaD/arsenite permease-like protein
MEIYVLIVFILGYVAITLEHPLKIDKLIPALMMMAVSWTLIALNLGAFNSWFDSHIGGVIDISDMGLEGRSELLHSTLLHHFGKTTEILVFLMGAMAIVEMIDHFEGFSSLKRMIRTNSKLKLLWIVSFLGFVLSAIIDNLTATIVLITILRKLVHNKEDRMWFAGMIIIAANAGGAWTPIGDVTTTMLWMADKVTTAKLAAYLFVPSLLCMIVPLIAASFLQRFKGFMEVHEDTRPQGPYAVTMLYIGLGMIVLVPIFKTVTHLPPYFGMMLSLGIYAVIAEILSKRLLKLTFGGTSTDQHTHHGPVLRALSKIEMPSILFFLGILMTVASMESLGMIFRFGQEVNASIPQELFVTILGVSSAVIDNVPLVAASIGMFTEVPDAHVWHMIAYAAGTGGSMLIIGSAAGVVAMGMEKISFGWYLRNITLLAALGYLAGMGALLVVLM